MSQKFHIFHEQNQQTEKSQTTSSSEEPTDIQNEIANLAETIGFTGVDIADVSNLLSDADKPLSDDELVQLLENREYFQTQNEEEDDPKPTLTLKNLADIINYTDEIKNIIEENDPDSERRCQAIEAVSLSVRCYKDLYMERKRTALSQPIINKFFKPVAATVTSSQTCANISPSDVDENISN